jgi:hypothetical protein
MAAEPTDVLRNIRNSLVDLFVSFTRVCFFWIPGGDVAQGKALMTFHPLFIGLVIAMFFVSQPQSLMRVFVLLFVFLIVASQWLLGGCVITRAEQRLTNSKDTILDPFLTLAGIEVTRDTRNAATMGASTAVAALLLCAFVCDWGRC